MVAAHAPDLAKYEADRDAATEFFTREYLRLLNENLDDYRRAYDATPKYAEPMAKPPDGPD